MPSSVEIAPGLDVAAMRDPRVWGAPEAQRVETRETHISWLFLVGARVFKLKKPLVLPFVDYGSIERRRQMCEREVELNRPLAGDLYVGVRPITRGPEGLELGGAGELVDHVVEMRRYDESATLEAALGTGALAADALAKVGRLIAAFHATAPARRPDDPIVAVRSAANANFEALAGADALEAWRVRGAARFSNAFLAAAAAEIEERARRGLVRLGHGDLRAEHVLLGDPIRVVDCVEFDDALRELDVGADLSFLVMDLWRLRRSDLAAELLAAYRDAGGDPGPESLIAFHAATRAWVRAKVALVRAHGARGGECDRALDRVRELFALGERLAWHARLPLSLVVCGPPASGKSSLAAALAAASGLPVVASDTVRKELAGVHPTERAPRAAYTAQASVRTYAELGRRATAARQRDGGVIVDATFGARSQRQAFAGTYGDWPHAILCECRASDETIRERAQRRLADPDRRSDAGPAVAARLAERFEPLEPDVAAERRLVLPTERAPRELAGEVAAMLDARLAARGLPRTTAPARREGG